MKNGEKIGTHFVFLYQNRNLLILTGRPMLRLAVSQGRPVNNADTALLTGEILRLSRQCLLRAKNSVQSLQNALEMSAQPK